MKNDYDINNPAASIEGKLRQYSTGEGVSERHEIMWHAWKHNKRWLTQLQEWIMSSFPTYSRHDESHALSVLHNIEMLLGEEQIGRLSASDCFLILHVVYIHDIGMCITHEERKKIIESKEFINFLEETKQSKDDEMRKHAELLLAYCKDILSMDSQEGVLQTKLDVYYAVLYLVSEYRRSEHSEFSKKLLYDWIDSPDKLGIGFSTSGIPSRFFYTVGSCASVHTSSNFEDIMNLHQEDMGFVHDYMHPRFAAVLLQLGDSLDLDNDRFHPLVREFMGELPQNSDIHFEKHKAIRRLHISPNSITIEADCKSAEVLRLVSIECGNIKSILRDATFHWSAICPKELNVCLPTLEPAKLLLAGQEINEGLVNVRFEIKQKKAFNLLQGSNIYKDDSFVFMREIFQNAIDASKMQYWKDWKGSCWYKEKEAGVNVDIDEMGRRLSPLSYPVEIEIYLAKKKNYKNEYIKLEKNSEENKKKDVDYSYGVLVRVTDHGIGMTAEDIRAIADVGTNYERYQKIRKGMPDWLQPTAEFGIGLQSAFLVTNMLTAHTHTRTEEEYRIEFQATGDKGEGYINVTPIEERGRMKTYGTTFELFVPNEKRKSHQEDLQFWYGRDPFSKEYDEEAPLRHARELAMQLARYLDDLIGERLFPIKLSMYDFEKNKDFEKIWDGKKERNFVYKLFIDGQEEILDEKKSSKIDMSEDEGAVTWSYKLSGKDNICRGKVDGEFEYWFDCDNIKLYLWISELNVWARFGADRLRAIREIAKNEDLDKKLSRTKVFYKGVLIKTFDWKEDANLLEYIDIKGKFKKEYLSISRGGFTQKGDDSIYEKIYPRVLEAAHKALVECESNEEILPQLKEKLEDLINNPRVSDAEKRDAVLSASVLAMYAQIQSASSYLAPNPKAENNHEEWNKLLADISLKIDEHKRKKSSWTTSTFFNIDVYRVLESGNGTEVSQIGRELGDNIANILNSKNKYAIVSKREGKGSLWEGYLVRLNPGVSSQDEDGSKENEIKVKQNIMRLKTQWGDKERRRNTIQIIEAWGDSLKEKFKGVRDDDRQRSKVLKQNMILNWALKNIPSIAMFFSEDSNLRINILALEHTDSMYFDMYTKWNIYERMYENYMEKGIERFSMIATTGFCQLALKNSRASIFYVKRGKFSTMGQRYNIFPLSGEMLKHIFEEKEKIELSLNKFCGFFFQYQEYVERAVSDYKEKKKDKNKDFLVIDSLIYDYFKSREEEMAGRMLLKIEEQLAVKLQSLSEKAEDREENANAEEKCFDDSQMQQILKWSYDIGGEEERNKTEKLVSQYILPKYTKIHMEQDFSILKEMLVKERIEELKNWLLENLGLQESEDEERKKSAETIERLIAYIKKSNWVGLSQEQIKTMYKLFVEDIIEELTEMSGRRMRQNIENNFLLKKIAGRSFRDEGGR